MSSVVQGLLWQVLWKVLWSNAITAMPITSEYDEDLVLTGHTDAADEAPKRRLSKKQEDKKDWKVWRDALESDEDSTDPKTMTKVQRQIAESIQGHVIQEEERNPVFQL